MTARNIVLIVHYFPPVNSSGAKRMEAMSKYFSRSGRNVTVLTTVKGEADGEFTERMPPGVTVLELNWRGGVRPFDANRHQFAKPAEQPVQSGRSLTRIAKDAVMHMFGQLPDPRLPFAMSFLKPRLAPEVERAVREADVIVATTPPWPPLLAAIALKRRFHKPVVLDYRDQFSLCHEMPGGRFAKALELPVDRSLAAQADALVTISEPMSAYYQNFHPDTHTILNGYDPEPLEAVLSRIEPVGSRDGPLIIRYMGLVSEGRIPRALLGALSRLKAAARVDPSMMQFEYYGEGRVMLNYLQEHHSDLSGFFKFLPRVSYSKSLELVATSDHLLFCENSIPPKAGEIASASGILTTKLFEYLASGRPILADIGPQTLAGSFAVRASDQHFVSDDTNAFEDYLLSESFRKPQAVARSAFVDSLSRAAQAQTYLALLDGVVAKSRA